MKIRNNFLLAFLFLTTASLQAQQIDKVFIDMPEVVLPSLNKIMRLELVEYYKMGQKDTTKNLFENKVFILEYDTVNSGITVQSSDNSRFEIKLFRLSGEKKDSAAYIIGTINTVCAPVCSSYIQFYDNKWNKIPLNVPKITAADFLTDKTSVKYGVSIAGMFPASFIEWTFDKPTNQIRANNHSVDFLSKEDQQAVKPFIKSENKTYKLLTAKKEVKFIP